MNFKDYLSESPVGSAGRTGAADADAHIASTAVGKDFAKMVKLLGGKTIAMKLLNSLNGKGQYVTVTKDHMKSDSEAAVPPLFESELQDKYQAYFQKMLKKFDASSPADMDEETMKKFFDAITSGWTKGKGEK